jgi:N-acetylglucosamine-6-phosphate deacetylase
MAIQGLDVATGRPLAVEADSTIRTISAGPDRKLPYLAPGFIDLQVNGRAGVDFGLPGTSLDEIARAIRSLHATGVSRFFPTVITGAPADMLAAVRNLAKARRELAEGESIEGLHVEGPFIAAEEGPRGAHPRQWVRAADIDEYQRWKEAAGGLLRIVTLAPECPGAIRLIERVAADGLVAAIGHTGATSAQIAAAVQAGATLSTHLGNGAHASLPRHPNYIWDQLAEDRLMAGFIADGIHLPAAFLKTAFRAKGVARSVLVTDAAPPAGGEPGRYTLAGQPVDLTPDGRVTLAGQSRLAGSALRMDRAVENAVKLGGVSLAEAVRMVTSNPAAVARIPGREAGLAAGQRADFVVFDYDPPRQGIAIRETWVSGQRVYAAPSHGEHK